MFFASYATIMLVVLGTCHAYLYFGQPFGFSEVVICWACPRHRCGAQMIFTTKNHCLMCNCFRQHGPKHGSETVPSRKFIQNCVWYLLELTNWLECTCSLMYFTQEVPGAAEQFFEDTTLYIVLGIQKLQAEVLSEACNIFSMARSRLPRPMICSAPWVGSGCPSVSWNICKRQENIERHTYSSIFTICKNSYSATVLMWRNPSWVCVVHLDIQVYIYIHFKWRGIHLSSRFPTGWPNDNEIHDPVYWLIISFHFDSFRLFGWTLSCIYTS